MREQHVYARKPRSIELTKVERMPSLISPETVVQRQLEAYNSRNIDALVSIYADDAQAFEHPATLLAAGSIALRNRFEVRFREPNLYAKLLSRVVMGSIVIDHEQVTRTFPEGTGTLDLIMIYEVQNEKIAKSWAITGAKTLDKSP